MINEKINLDVCILDKEQKGELKRSKILVNNIKTGLYPVKLKNGENINIFIIPEKGKEFNNNILICKLDGEDCYILYKMKINIMEFIEKNSIVCQYIKDIVEDEEKEIGVVVLSILKMRRSLMKTFLNQPYDYSIMNKFLKEEGEF